MYKKILIMSLLIPSLILAHNLPEEKLNELKNAQEKHYSELSKKTEFDLKKEKLKELKVAQEKHYSECQEAKSDLKLALLALVAIPLFIGAGEIIMFPLGLHSILINNFGNPLTDQIIHKGHMLIGISFGGYSVYKAIIGLQHYFWPDYPTPDDKKI